ncbi:hypothetical protein MKW92_041546 [Papaver armeniacum]|nr:hypothetical protein MKW92_041546 [Papaver armeniacum]
MTRFDDNSGYCDCLHRVFLFPSFQQSKPTKDIKLSCSISSKRVENKAASRFVSSMYLSFVSFVGS